MKKVWLSWSSGKDSAWTLYTLQMERNFEVTGLFTTVTEQFDRISMHGVRTSLLETQVVGIGLPLYVAKIPWPCSDKLYRIAMESVWEVAIQNGVDSIAFGDLFLEDIRRYRIDLLGHTELQPIFPLWGKPTQKLAREMMSKGLRAILTCVDPSQLPAEYAGREYNSELLDELPSSVDPCGENGEFHTFVHSGPMFSEPLNVNIGNVVERGGFVFTDVTLGLKGGSS